MNVMFEPGLGASGVNVNFAEMLVASADASDALINDLINDLIEDLIDSVVGEGNPLEESCQQLADPRDTGRQALFTKPERS